MQARQKSVDELRKKEYSHRPKIDKNSKKIMLNLQKYLYFKDNDINNGVRAGHNINASIKEETFDKLLKDELFKRTERQKALAKIYNPTFSPKVFKFNTNTNTNNKNNTENINEENNQNKKDIKSNKKDIRICNNVYQINNMMNKGNNNNIIIGEYNNKNNKNESENYQNCYINNDFDKQIKSRFFEKLSNTKNNRSIDLNEEIKKEINKEKDKRKYNGNIKYNNNNEKNIKDNISNNYQKISNNINSKNKNYEIRVHLNDKKEYLSNGKDKKRYRNKSVEH